MDSLIPLAFAKPTLVKYKADFLLWQHFNEVADESDAHSSSLTVITHHKAKVFLAWLHVVYPTKSGPVLSAHLTGVASILAIQDVEYTRSRAVTLFVRALKMELPPTYRPKKPWSIFHCIGAAKHCVETYTDLTCFAGVLLGYGALMRCSEFAKKYSNWTPLRYKQLTMHDNEAFIVINKSKTNPYGKREIITVPCYCFKRTGIMFAAVEVQSSFCPFCVLKRYLRHRNSRFDTDPESLLLIKDNGVELIMYNVQDYMQKVIKAMNSVYGFKLDPTPYTTHSLRVGGTTDLARCGVPAHLIESMGRWLTAIWRRTYISSDYRDICTISGLTASFLKQQCLFV